MMYKQVKLFVLFSFLLLTLCSFIQKEKPVIYLVGDSTMAPKKEEKRPETGWGEKIPLFFTDMVEFENHARNGRSSKSFIKEGRWDAVVKSLSPGDYVFIQFGHNDESKEKGERYSTPEEFRENLIRYVEDTRAKNAEPVLLTPVMRRRFDDNGKFYDTHGIYPDITRGVAAEYHVPLIDHHRLSEKIIKEFGEEGSKELFLHLKPGEYKNYPEGRIDDTHFSPLGATFMAESVAGEIRNENMELAKYLNGTN